MTFASLADIVIDIIYIREVLARFHGKWAPKSCSPAKARDPLQLLVLERIILLSLIVFPPLVHWYPRSQCVHPEGMLSHSRESSLRPFHSSSQFAFPGVVPVLAPFSASSQYAFLRHLPFTRCIPFPPPVLSSSSSQHTFLNSPPFPSCMSFPPQALSAFSSQHPFLSSPFSASRVPSPPQALSPLSSQHSFYSSHPFTPTPPLTLPDSLPASLPAVFGLHSLISFHSHGPPPPHIHPSSPPLPSSRLRNPVPFPSS